MTGHQPATDTVTGAYAGHATGHVAAGVADDNMPSPGAVSPAARSQLEAIRDEWLQPLVDQLREAERTIGRLEAERDQAAQERDVLRSQLAEAHEQVTSVIHESGHQTSDVAAEESETRPAAWRRLWRQVTEHAEE
jgi:hypothetical protein